MSEIDCRGKACPEPVVITKNALEQLREGALIVIVDDPSSCENVERFARSQGFAVTVEKKEKDFRLHIQRENACGEIASSRAVERARNVVIYINSHLLGAGEDALGEVLMKAFLKTIQDLPAGPSRMIFINSGVRLTWEGSAVLESLRVMSEKGVDILSCGTCLDFYGLKEKLKVGRVSNMYEIAGSLLNADTLVKP